jgi:hypothetical protein
LSIMAVSKPTVCPSCGFQRNPKGSARCVSCGAKLEEIGRSRRPPAEDRYQQEAVSIPWLLIAFVVQAVLTAAVVFGLPLILPILDFEGQNGMVVCIPVWFIGGFLVGLISPGRTFIEPAIAALLVAIPTTFLLIQSQTVRIMPMFLYLIFAGIGILLTLIGAYMGERIQLGPPPKPAE